MTEFPAPWWVVGGHAIEAFTGVRRFHEDIDLVVFSDDLPALREQFRGVFHLWSNHGGTFRIIDDEHPEPLHPLAQVWMRRDARSPWRVDCPVNPSRDGLWQSKRDEDQVAPLDEVTWVADDGSATSTPSRCCSTRLCSTAPRTASTSTTPGRSSTTGLAPGCARRSGGPTRTTPGSHGSTPDRAVDGTPYAGRCNEQIDAVYLDHAASTPMYAEAVAAMTAAAHAPRQPLVAARLRPGGAPGRRGVPRDDRPGARLPARRGGVHLGRHRVGQPRAQGPVLGPPRPGPASHPHPRRPPSSTTPCSTRCTGSPSTRAPRSSCSPSTGCGRLDVDALRAIARARPRRRSRWSR